MNTFSFLLFDIGIPGEVPGFDPSFLSSTFPLLSGHTSLDCALSAASGADSAEKRVFCPKEKMKTVHELTSRQTVDIGIFPLEDFFITLESVVSRSSCTHFVLWDLSSVFSFSGNQLDDIARSAKSQGIVKLSVDNTPVNAYAVTRKNLSDLLSRIQSRNADPSPSDIFNRLFHDFHHMHDVPGVLYFLNNLREFVDSSLAFIQNGTFFPLPLSTVPGLTEKETIIGKTGDVKHSLIGPGCKIDGIVENSLLYYDVQVKEDAVVRDSVVLPGNIIGKKSAVRNTLILPSVREIMTGSNIGDKCVIGGKSQAVNRDYPDCVYGGLTVLGQDCDIPAEFVIEPASVIGALTPKAVLKQNKSVRRGSTVNRKEL